MANQTLSPARPIVKLSDDVQAGIARDTLHIQHRATVVAALDLEEAIKVAQMVLRYAERFGITIPEAVEDIRSAGEAVIDDEDGYRPRF